VRLASSLCDDVEFSPMDATRSDIEFMYQMLAIAIEEGATTLNIPDTVGYSTPEEYAALLRGIIENVPGAADVIISTHCHDDLGLAVANSLAGVRAGARQIECTINGIGERAGNASLEEVVMALETRKQFYGLSTNIDTTQLTPSSRLLSACTNTQVPPNKAIVGDNAFSHESGIHQDGMLKNRQTYEVMTPESVGVPQTSIVLGRHSGKHGLSSRLLSLGYNLDDTELEAVYKRFVEVADKKKEVYDDDLRVLMGDERSKPKNAYELDYLHINSGTASIPTATIRIRHKEQIFEESAIGDGPVDACFRAIERALGIESMVTSYSVRSTTAGRQALGEALVRIRDKNVSFNGRGVSTDIIEASAKAYLQALGLRQHHFDNITTETIESGV